jgi:peptide/nickel transport system permease protein
VTIAPAEALRGRSTTRRKPARSTERGPMGRLVRDPGAVVGALLLLLIAAALVGAPWLATQDPLATDVPDKLAGFSRDHLLGTDSIGRDMWSRMLHGGRSSVVLTLAVSGLVTVIGLVLGVLAGMRGGIVDAAILRTIEIVQAVPLIIVAMVTVKLLGGGTEKLVLVLALLGWPGQARVVRAATLSLREREFIKSCQVIGATRWRVAFRHIVPNLLSPVVVIATLDVGRTLLTISTLSFLGFGARPPHPEWGSMLADAKTYFFVAPRLLMIPGAAIFLVALGANLFGEGLRDAFQGRSERT